LIYTVYALISSITFDKKEPLETCACQGRSGLFYCYYHCHYFYL